MPISRRPHTAFFSSFFFPPPPSITSGLVEGPSEHSPTPIGPKALKDRLKNFPEKYLDWALNFKDQAAYSKFHRITSPRSPIMNAKDIFKQLRKEKIMMLSGRFGSGKSLLCAELCGRMLRAIPGNAYYIGRTISTYSLMLELGEILKRSHKPAIIFIDDLANDLSCSDYYERLLTDIFPKFKAENLFLVINGQELFSWNKKTIDSQKLFHVELASGSRRQRLMLTHEDQRQRASASTTSAETKPDLSLTFSSPDNIIVAPSLNLKQYYEAAFLHGEVKILFIYDPSLNPKNLPAKLPENTVIFQWKTDTAAMPSTARLNEIVFKCYEQNQPLIIHANHHIADHLRATERNFMRSSLHDMALSDRIKETGIIVELPDFKEDELNAMQYFLDALKINTDRKTQLLEKILDLLNNARRLDTSKIKDPWGVPTTDIRPMPNAWEDKQDSRYTQLSEYFGGGNIDTGLFGYFYPVSLSLLFGLVLEEKINALYQETNKVKNLLERLETHIPYWKTYRSPVYSPFLAGVSTRQTCYLRPYTLSGMCITHMKAGIYQVRLEVLLNGKLRHAYTYLPSDLVRILDPDTAKKAAFQECVEHVENAMIETLSKYFPDITQFIKTTYPTTGPQAAIDGGIFRRQPGLPPADVLAPTPLESRPLTQYSI